MDMLYNGGHGGCCKFEMCTLLLQLAQEREKFPVASQKHAPWGEGLRHHAKACIRAK